MVTAQAWRTGDGSEASISYCLLAVTLDLSRFPVPQLQKRDGCTVKYWEGWEWHGPTDCQSQPPSHQLNQALLDCHLLELPLGDRTPVTHLKPVASLMSHFARGTDSTSINDITFIYCA